MGRRCAIVMRRCARVRLLAPGEGARRVAANTGKLQVEILRALARDAQLIVMDEVTAALTPDECERLFSVIRQLNAEGRTIVYISHFLEEVLSLAGTVSVLRDGLLIRTGPTEKESPATLISAMLGRVVELDYPAKKPPPVESPSSSRCAVFRAVGLQRHLV